MRKYFLVLISILILTASPALAENGSTTLTTNSKSTTASFTFDFGDKKGAKDYPTISTFESTDATLDLDKNIFTASASKIPGEDLIALIGDYNPETKEIRGTFTGFQNYESKNGKIYTRTSFDGAFGGKIEAPEDSVGDYLYGSSTVEFSKVFCSKLSASGLPDSKASTQICPAENTTYKGTLSLKGMVNITEPSPIIVPVQAVIATTTSVVADPGAMPLIKYGAFLFIIALIVYAIYFAVSGGFF